MIQICHTFVSYNLVLNWDYGVNQDLTASNCEGISPCRNIITIFLLN